VLLVVIAVAAAMLAATGLSLWQETKRYTEAKQESLRAVAHVFASATASATASGDQVGALHAIRAIGRVPNILHARIETLAGARLAVLGFASQLDSDLRVDTGGPEPSAWKVLNSKSLQVAVPIVNAGEPVGRFIVVGDTSDLIPQLFENLRYKAIGGALALVVGLVVAARFQRGITSPLRSLTEAMARIRESHDYGSRVEATTRDEVGILVDGFNEMLAEIRERDRRIDEHLQDLERQVADRTQDLRAARDVAEAASAAKSDFLATMSHEIRTPMNGIMVMAELLAGAQLPDRQRRYADVIAKSGQSLLAIINDILDFSKIESGKLELEAIQLDPAEIADNVTSLFGERARAKGLDLAAYISPAVTERMVGDPVRLNQVLGNLVNNALKFTEKGHVLLTIEPDESDAERVRFAVSDSGIGIPQDKLNTIFSAFSQADQSTTRRFGGTGLGLAICKRLIAAMSSEVVVTSEYGKGSVFSFSIPIGQPIAKRAWPCVSKPGGSLSVVAVDGAATKLALSRYLTEAGYVVSDPAAHAEATAEGALVIADAASAQDFTTFAKTRGKPVLLCLSALGDPTADRLVASGQAAGALSRPLLHAELKQVLSALAVGKAPVVSSAASSRASEAEFQFPGLRVLVADDSPVNREVVIEALSRMAAAVDVVEDGVQAVAAVEANEYDVVLMDGSMPEMDGFEACKRIRAAEKASGSPRLPVVALTAHVVGSAADAWQEADMDGVLHKPFTMRALGQCLAQFVPQDKVDARARAAATVPIEQTPAAPETAPSKPDSTSLEDDPILNPEVLAQLDEMAANGRPDFVARVCGLYLEHAPNTRNELWQAAASGDLEGIGRAAHALKSMSYNIGAGRLAKIAGHIEHGARIDQKVLAKAEYDELAAILDTTLEAIRARLMADSAQLQRKRAS
jgi:signal transduction histidine kinase/CheY-like chemotaxis protein/HPt (histidine-containing phosphotransfer) domain-containing protein